MLNGPIARQRLSVGWLVDPELLFFCCHAQFVPDLQKVAEIQILDEGRKKHANYGECWPWGLQTTTGCAIDG
jgi:hypothetical protein